MLEQQKSQLLFQVDLIKSVVGSVTPEKFDGLLETLKNSISAMETTKRKRKDAVEAQVQ